MNRSKIKVGAKIRYKMGFDIWVDGTVVNFHENGNVDIRLKGYSLDYCVNSKDVRLEVIN